MLKLDHRYTKVKAALETGAEVAFDPYEALLADHLDPSMPFVSASIAGAIALYGNPYQRSVVESTLLAATLEEAADYVGVEVGTLREYTTYFFDLSLIPNRIGKFEYVGALPDGVDKERKHVAITLGGEFLHLRMGKTIALEPDEVLSRLLTDAYTMARQSMVTAKLNSKSTRESYRWAALAVKIAESLARRAGAAQDDDLFSDLVIEPIYDASGDPMDDIDLTSNNIVRG